MPDLTPRTYWSKMCMGIGLLPDPATACLIQVFPQKLCIVYYVHLGSSTFRMFVFVFPPHPAPNVLSLKQFRAQSTQLQYKVLQDRMPRGLCRLYVSWVGGGLPVGQDAISCVPPRYNPCSGRLTGEKGEKLHDLGSSHTPLPYIQIFRICLL